MHWIIAYFCLWAYTCAAAHSVSIHPYFLIVITMFSNVQYLPPEIVFEILTQVYGSVENLADFLSLRLVNKSWKDWVEAILKRQGQPPRRCQVNACLEYENEDYFKDFCIPAHTMSSDEQVVCRGVPRKRTHESSHFGEYLLQKLTLVRAARISGINTISTIAGVHETHFPQCVTAVGRRTAVMTNMNGRVIIKDFETGLTKKTIPTGCPGIIDIKVLNLQSSEYLVWLSKNGSLGISEVEVRTDELLCRLNCLYPIYASICNRVHVGVRSLLSLTGGMKSSPSPSSCIQKSCQVLWWLWDRQESVQKCSSFASTQLKKWWLSSVTGKTSSGFFGTTCRHGSIWRLTNEEWIGGRYTNFPPSTDATKKTCLSDIPSNTCQWCSVLHYKVRSGRPHQTTCGYSTTRDWYWWLSTREESWTYKSASGPTLALSQTLWQNVIA